jgi:hypothetical protein
MITVAVERTTQSSPQVLIDGIWSGLEWKRHRSGILGLAIEYDDACHQSVQVCVDWRPRYLSMSVVRFRDSATRISFFYSRLPPGVVQQLGVWEASAVDGGCCLRLVRKVQLQRGRTESAALFRAREEAHRILLEGHLREHLGLILDVEGQHAGGETKPGPVVWGPI